MKFQTEIDLVEALKAFIEKAYKRSNIQIFEEVSVGYGVADIVVSDLYSLSYQSLQRMTKEDSLRLLDINIYSIIQNSHNLTTEEIVDLTRCSKKAVNNSLRKLTNYGYFFQEDAKFSINKKYEFPFRTNFAIEAKLKDWKRALKQAYRYRWFAEYSFVVLDTHHSNAALKNIEQFIKYNVGLASISPDGVLKKHFYPVRQKPFDPKMQMLFSEKVKSDTIQIRLPSA